MPAFCGSYPGPRTRCGCSTRSGLEQLSVTDLRASLLSYVLNPPPALAAEVLTDVTADEPHPAFRSLFDQRVFLRIQERGFHVTPQVEVNGRGIDLVVTGAKGRLAVECDGQDWHGSESSARPTWTASASSSGPAGGSGGYGRASSTTTRTPRWPRCGRRWTGSTSSPTTRRTWSGATATVWQPTALSTCGGSGRDSRRRSRKRSTTCICPSAGAGPA